MKGFKAGDYINSVKGLFKENVVQAQSSLPYEIRDGEIKKNYPDKFRIKEKEIVLIGINFDTGQRNVGKFEVIS